LFTLATDANAPSPSPTGLSATPASETQINLSWIDASADETGFKIFQGGSLIHTTAANATSYNVTDLTCNTGYAFTVAATNANGDSSAAATTPTTTTTAACSGGGVPAPISASTLDFNQSIEVFSKEIKLTE
jgi:chitin-binding protein